jgi:hypothetical protein
MERRSISEEARRWLARLERVIPWLALAGAAVGLFLVLRGQRDALAALESVGWAAIAPSALAFMLAPLLQGVSSWIVLRMLTGRTPLLEAMVVWSRSYVIRYAPTGTLAVAYRVSARGRVLASTDQVLAAFAYEHVAVLAAAAAVCLVLFPLAGTLPPLLPLGIALATLALTAAMRPGIAGRAVEAAAGRLRIRLQIVLEGRQLAAVVAVNALGWLGTGTAAYLLVASVTGDPPPFVWLVATYTAAYLVGFVAPLAPGGRGVREGMLVVLLGPSYGLSVAVAISLAIRLANVAGELLAVALVHGVYAVQALAASSGRVAVGTTTAEPAA